MGSLQSLLGYNIYDFKKIEQFLEVEWMDSDHTQFGPGDAVRVIFDSIAFKHYDADVTRHTPQ